MGFLDGLFGGDKPTDKNIAKLVVRVKERYAQTEYRREAMEKLIAWGTPESILGVLQRFTIVAQSPHWDEVEKGWLVDELAQLGSPGRQALKTFLGRENNIAFAAKALQRMDKPEEYFEDVVAALKAHPPDDYRSTQGKTELIACLADIGDARAVDVMLPYADDHGDDVQCSVVDALEKLWPKAAPHDEAVKKLQQMVGDDARSARVLRHAASAMQRMQVPIDATRPLAPAVAEDFVVKEGKLAPQQ